jgi:hypothetical protein
LLGKCHYLIPEGSDMAVISIAAGVEEMALSKFPKTGS